MSGIWHVLSMPSKIIIKDNINLVDSICLWRQAARRCSRTAASDPMQTLAAEHRAPVKKCSLLRSKWIGTPLLIGVPVSVGVLWLFVRRRGRARRHSAAAAARREVQVPQGATVDLQPPKLPPRGPALPFVPPAPLKVVLADVRLPTSSNKLWQGVFANPSAFLTLFHTARKDFNLTVSPWTLSEGDALAVRTLQYISPLSNPMGPKQALNTEEMEAVQLTATGFVVRARCVSEGVPFSSSFANYLQFVAVEGPAGTTRFTITALVVAGECRFHGSVWGPLKGTVETESIKGMAKAYKEFAAMLGVEFGSLGGGGDGGGGGGGTPLLAASAALGAAGSVDTPRSQLLSLLGGPGASGGGQQGTVRVLALVIVVVVVYRLSLGDELAVQLLRQLMGRHSV